MVMGPPSSQLGRENWLTQVLNDQGSIHLPYSDNLKFVIRQHLLDLVAVSTQPLDRKLPDKLAPQRRIYSCGADWADCICEHALGNPEL